MRVLALGSCRVHDPLAAVAQQADIDLLNPGFRRHPPIYLHDIHEALQFVRLVRGEIDMPVEFRLFAYDGGLDLNRHRAALLQQAEAVVFECCTDKHYEVAGWTLNVNEIQGWIVGMAGAAGAEWWLAIDRGERPADALVGRVEAALRSGWRGRWRMRGKFGAAHRLVLRELAFRYLPAAEIAEGLARLRALLARPLLVMPHVAVRLPDGGFLAERRQHIDKTIEAARLAGLPLFDPRDFVERDGQARALDKAGTDFNHYAADYLPIAGREIAEALRRCTAPS